MTSDGSGAALVQIRVRVLRHHDQRVANLDMSDPAAVDRIVDPSKERSLTLCALAGRVGHDGGQPIEEGWPNYQPKYKRGSPERTLDTLRTFVDIAMTSDSCPKHLPVAPPENGNKKIVRLSG